MAFTKKSALAAIRNITRHGDTDVYPFPIENHMFFDDEDKVVDVLHSIHKDFKKWLSSYPPIFVKSLATSGYSGFRAPTQIDPVWNAYLLTLVLSIARELEVARLPVEEKAVFSYRYSPDAEDCALFSKKHGFRQYHERSIQRAQEFKFVLVCDISDFYPRVYHHRLENALKKSTTDTEAIRRIMKILSHLSDGVSYGLPIGGPAARILAEILLNRTDKLLTTEGIPFCRFVDDYHLFADSLEEAYSHLVTLSEALMNEGLSLQKTKTRIMSSEEFISASPYSEANDEDSDSERTSRAFLKVRLRYDPYSPTAEDDYEALKRDVSQFDVVGMLSKELRKTRIDETLTKQLVKSIRFLDPDVRDNAILSLADNLVTLYPVFPTVSLVLVQILPETNKRTQEHVYAALRKLVRNESYILRVSANLAYAVRLFARDPSREAEQILATLFRKESSLNPMLQRDIILSMAKRNADYWVSNCLKQFSSLSPWGKRALIVASYILEDEGEHWRTKVRPQLGEPELLALDWAATRKSRGSWEIPL